MVIPPDPRAGRATWRTTCLGVAMEEDGAWWDGLLVIVGEGSWPRSSERCAWKGIFYRVLFAFGRG
jgi:hypothetical protein